MRSAALRALAEIKKRPENSRHVSMINSIRIRFNSQPINNARAFIDNNGIRVIEFYAGVMVTIEQIALARSFSLLPDFKLVAERHISYTAQWVSKVRRGVGINELGPLKGFFDFAGINDTQVVVNIYQKYPFVRQAFSHQVDCSVAFILAHELAHHILDHRGRPASALDSRSREENADTVAVQLVSGTPMPAIGAIPILLSFYLMDPEADINDPISSHPDPRRRILKIARSGYDAMINDPEFRNYLVSQGKFDEFRQGAEQEIAAFAQAIDSIGQ
jgi:hypothetical protein